MPLPPHADPPASPAPSEVRTAAEARAAARERRDWPTADRLRGEIEAAGWKVIDAGTAFRLEPAHPADVETGGERRYGRSDAVPSRLADAPTGLATVVVVAREDAAGSRRAATGLLANAPAGVDLVVVADGLGDDAANDLAGGLAADGRAEGGQGADGHAAEGRAADRVELVRTSAPLGQGAALNIGLRRSRGATVIVLDASIEPTGDIVSPLVAALEDPRVAVAGPFGLRSADLRHFEETTADPAAAIEGYAMAFRRADAMLRGPIDEAFRFYRNLDVWWSLVLRDEGQAAPRTARVVAGLPLRRHEHVAWASMTARDRDRLSKRNFYRILDRFRNREDLAAG